MLELNSGDVQVSTSNASGLLRASMLRSFSNDPRHGSQVVVLVFNQRVEHRPWRLYIGSEI